MKPLRHCYSLQTFHLGRFVAVSMLLHILLLLNWQYKDKLDLGGEHVTTIAVTLDSPTRQKQHHQVPHKASAEPPTHRMKKISNSTSVMQVPARSENFTVAKQQTALKKPLSQPLKDISVVEEAVSSPVDRDADSAVDVVKAQQLLRQIKVEFSRYYQYPRQALRRNIQGEVILAFTLDAKGMVSNVSVARSSGHGILDRAAAASLNKVMVKEAPDTDLSFELPVIYKINNG